MESSNINYSRGFVTPQQIIGDFLTSESGVKFIEESRKNVCNLISGKDDRLLVVLGPCSIHDINSAIEYGRLIKEANLHYTNDLFIVMRTFFEKPRTRLGWKGLINDPSLDATFNIEEGLRLARKLLLELNQMEVPTSTEFLNTVIPQFISDLVAWGVIGARTTTSQVHRELVSGLSMPVGFKNSINGCIQTAVDAVFSASLPHQFLNINKKGKLSLLKTKGNKFCSIILRGGQSEPNYDKKYIKSAVNQLTICGLLPYMVIDFSHGNSLKDYTLQKKVADDVAKQISDGEFAICGVMLESNLVAGAQAIDDSTKLIYGKSITDACIDWEETKAILNVLAKAVRKRRQTRDYK